VGADVAPVDAAQEPPLIVCLAGPTGTGKSELALQLAAEFAVDIVSVDSAMVYRHMDIGTAKPSATVRHRLPHHLVDVRNPWESYSAGSFRADALRVIAAVHAGGRIPLLVGGTMLYFRSLLRGLAPLPVADPAVRAELDEEARERGWPALHAELGRVDPAAAVRIAPLDRQRIQRALEVYRLTGKPISELQARQERGQAMRFVRIALVPADRDALYQRLDQRLSGMLAAGFVDEVRRLMALPTMSVEVPAMRSVGYRQLWMHLAGEVGLDEAVRQASVATRRLAKRQLTWLRSEPVDLVLDPMADGLFDRLAAALAQSGVSRRGARCNIMGSPLECRDHGV
jgi:tRNA dimethylallyltransferase